MSNGTQEYSVESCNLFFSTQHTDYYLIELFESVDNSPCNVFFDPQSGCCKPSDECGYTYVSPTQWTAPANFNSTNPDCSTWANDATALCFNCQSCKAGVLDNLKSNWKKVAVINIIFLIFLIIVYSVGCCAFRNNRRDNSYWK